MRDSDEEEEDKEPSLALPIESAAASHHPTPAPSQTPEVKQEQTPPPPPPSPPAQPSPERERTPTPTPDPFPGYQLPLPSEHGSPGGPIIDSDNDNMLKAMKAFDKVTLLKSDGSNWDTWKTRVELAARSIQYEAYLKTKLSNSSNSQKEADSNLLNAVIGRLSDGIFRRYKNYPTTKQLWSNLCEDYDSKSTLTESFLQRKLHTMQCTDPTKVNKHLNEMIEIKDSLAV